MGKPSQRVRAKPKIARIRKRRKSRMPQHGSVNAPADQQDHHDGDQLHDVQRFFARFSYALGVLPPEICRDDDGEGGGDTGDGGFRKGSAQVSMLGEIAEQATEIVTGGNTANRPREGVVERQPPAAAILQHASKGMPLPAEQNNTHALAEPVRVYREYGAPKPPQPH